MVCGQCGCLHLSFGMTSWEIGCQDYIAGSSHIVDIKFNLG